MKALKIAVLGLTLIFLLGWLAIFAQSVPPTQNPEAKPKPKLGLPKEIRAIIQEGLVTRQGRQDVPFTIFKSMGFPIQGGMHTILFIKAKNSSLGYATPAPSRQGRSGVTEAAAPGVLEARLVAALEFLQPDETGVLKPAREMGFPVTLQTDSASYDPAKEEWYSLGVSLPYGKYTLGMLLAPMDPVKGAPNLRKVGVGYCDIDVPGPEAYANGLETTPIFFAKDIRQMASPEGKPVFHKGFFTYSVLQLVPNIDAVVTAEDKAQVEAFFVVLGAKEATVDTAAAPAAPKFSIDIYFELQKEDGAPVVKWETRKFTTQYIAQPLRLMQTKTITDPSGKQSEIQTEIGAGKYVLIVKIKDLYSGLSAEKKVPFEMR